MSVLGIVLLSLLGVVILGVIVVVCWAISVYNKLIRLRNNAEEAYSTMDVYMKKRYDLIPNLVETVKGYAKHENQTLENVMKARYDSMNANTVEDKSKAENILTGTLKTLFSITENYPDLKANQNFRDLQNTLQNLESEIASSRKYYNGCVKVYNVKTEVFPSSIIARKYKFEKKSLFEITDAEERKAPKVQF